MNKGLATLFSQQRIRLISTGAEGESFEIGAGDLPIRLGRSEDAGISVRDRWLSRHHCEFQRVDGELMVRDLDSKHGTFINSCRIDEAPLRPGDELSVGLSKFVAQYEGSSSNPT